MKSMTLTRLVAVGTEAHEKEQFLKSRGTKGGQRNQRGSAQPKAATIESTTH
jgi:hypothetical protein